MHGAVLFGCEDIANHKNVKTILNSLLEKPDKDTWDDYYRRTKQALEFLKDVESIPLLERQARVLREKSSDD